MDFFDFFCVKLKWLFIGSILCLNKNSFSQCIGTDFSLPASVCKDSRIYVQNLAGIADGFTWDFCVGDLENTPKAMPLTTLSGANGRPSIELVHDGLKWYGFVTGTFSNTLFRLEFANGVNQQPTFVENLGDLSGKLSGPGSVRALRENGLWYVFVLNGQAGEILKLAFGNNLGNAFTTSLAVSNLPPGLNGGLAFGKDASEGWICVVSTSTNQFQMIRMGASLATNNPTDIITSASVPNPNSLGDVDLINVCGNWIAFADNLGNGNVYRLDFGSSLFSIPTITQIASISVANPGRLRILKDGDQYFVLIAALDGTITKLKFGNALSSPPVIIQEGDVGGVLPANLYGLGVAIDNSVWTIMSVNQSNGQVFKIDYPNSCAASPATSSQTNPLVSFSQAGSFKVALSAINSGIASTKVKTLSVSYLVAPDIDFSYQNYCANNAVLFTSITSGNVNLFNWDFGNSTNSSQPNPSANYSSAGAFVPSLVVTSTNGCTNSIKKNLQIFNAPLASFTLPPNSPLCTNQSYSLVNSSLVDVGLTPSWQWTINGINVSNSQDLNVSFSSTASQTIALQATIPGCSSTFSQTINSLTAGPLVNFTAPASGCQSTAIFFTNTTTGSVTGYQWSFGDGNTSFSANATNTFTNRGQYNVTLQANNAAGCQNTTTKSIIVYTKPQPDFSVGLPPFSCAGTASQFTDTTPIPSDSNITGWQWAFGDATNGTSTFRNPTFTYPLAGTYNVSLLTSTNFGCTNSLTKSITIAPSPIANFTNAIACANQPTQFTDASTGSIRSRLWNIQSNSFSSPSVQFSFASAGSFPVSLTVTGNNNCVSQFSKTINVPVQPLLDFSIQAPCSTNPTIFTEVTSGADVAVSQLWTFGGLGNGTGATAQFVFSTPNNYSIQLRSERQSGCTYSITKNVSITQGPVADFIPSADIGAPPLAVSFANTSTNANSFLWKFGDANNSTSTQTNPNFTFTDLGMYAVKLTAFNESGCSFIISKPITILVPSVNVVLSDLSLVPDQQTGALQPMLTILNKSNVPITNPDVLVDVESSRLIKKKVIGKIQPNQSLSVLVDLQIVPHSANYICAEVDIANNTADFDKRKCLPLSSTEILFSPYPNPVKDNLNFDWISNEPLPVNVIIFTSLGSMVFEQKFTSVATGLNRLELNTSTLPNGLYYINYSDSKTTKSFSFTIAK